MPVATVRGVDINYEVLGERGPWVALQPGGRRALVGVKSLGEKLAEAGCRVLVYDRRNCGASGVSFDGGNSENEIWAEDLRALLSHLDALPAYIGGSSSGCRLALLMALRHPAAVRGLLLWRVTGGAYAAQRLVENYYTQFINAAHQRQIRIAHRVRRVVGTGAANADQLHLPGYRQRVGTINHFFTLSKPALPSAPDKKSFSSDNWPIFACSVFRSTGGSLFSPAGAPNTSAARSCNCRFHSVIWFG